MSAGGPVAGGSREYRRGRWDATAGLESQLQLKVEPLRVTLLIRPADQEEPTPKLRSVARWLARMDAAGESNWDAVSGLMTF